MKLTTISLLIEVLAAGATASRLRSQQCGLGATGYRLRYDYCQDGARCYISDQDDVDPTMEVYDAVGGKTCYCDLSSIYLCETDEDDAAFMDECDNRLGSFQPEDCD